MLIVVVTGGVGVVGVVGVGGGGGGGGGGGSDSGKVSNREGMMII